MQKCENCGAVLRDCFTPCHVCGSEYQRPIDVRKRGMVEIRGERIVSFDREDVIILNADIRFMHIDDEDCIVIRHNPSRAPQVYGCHVVHKGAVGPFSVSPATT